jgi:RNA polymerase sigma factor (sigma-70 family)
MHDREIVAAVVAGDPAGLAAAFDGYATALYAYCRSLLAQPDDAADAVQDTFVIAAARLGGLRDPDRLRPWLYAVARNECHRRLRGRARLAELDEAGEMTDPAAGPAEEAGRSSVAELVVAAIAGLNPGDREVIEMTLRHDLDGADLADALGVPVNQAHALASRARGQLERSLGALLVARAGRASCAELDAILGGWDGRLTILLRKRVSRHIEQCEVCGDRQRRELSPAMLLGTLPLPLLVMPAGLRGQVLRLVSSTSPADVSYRDHVARRAGKFRRSGFPAQVSPAITRRPGWLPGAAALLLAAVLIVLAGGGVTTFFLLSHRHHATDRSAAAAGTSPATTPPAPLPSVAASPSPSAPPATPSPAAPSPSAPATTPPATPATLEVTPDPVPLELVPTAGPPVGGYRGQFTLTAAGGPVSFTLSQTTAEMDAYAVTVSVASGTADPGTPLTITVSVAARRTGGSMPSIMLTYPGAAPQTIEFSLPSPSPTPPIP